MCVEIQFCTHQRLWDVIFSLNKSKSLSTTGQALWHLYILSPVIFPLTHMYSVEPSSRRLNCTEVETGQRRKAPSPRCIILFNSFIHGKNYAVKKTTRSSAGIETTRCSDLEVWWFAGVFSGISDHKIFGGFSESHIVLQSRTKRRLQGALQSSSFYYQISLSWEGGKLSPYW